MSANAQTGHRGARTRVTLERRSLRLLELRSSLPRYVLYAVAVVAIAHTLATLLVPRRAAAPAARSAGVDVAAAGYAVAFARAYLSYDSADPAARDAALGPFVGGGASAPDAGFTAPSTGSSEVTFAQVVADHADPFGGEVFTVQADTSRLGTVYVAVTVAHRAGGGPLELVGEPALVGPPASAPAVADPSQAHEAISDPGVTQVVTRALSNYLRGDGSDLQSDLAPGVAVSLPPIVLGAIQVSRIAWQQPGRVVGVDVRAADQAGGVYSLHYELSVRRWDRWYVTGIESTPNSGG